MMDSYLRRLDDSTDAEIVVYTIPGFAGHGINKDSVETRDGDMLANYIFNEVSLEGITGVGKKDNGVPILLSLERDGSGGAMRIEIGRGLEGTITGGLAGEVLDRYLVPAYTTYEETGGAAALGAGLYDTARAVGHYIALEGPGMQRESHTTCPGRVHDKVRE